MAELQNFAEIQSVPHKDMGIAMVSDDAGAREPTSTHRQKLWELVEQSEQCLSREEKEQLFALLLTFLPPQPKIGVKPGESNTR